MNEFQELAPPGVEVKRNPTAKEKWECVMQVYGELKNEKKRPPSGCKLAEVTGVSYPTVVKYCIKAGLPLKGNVRTRDKMAKSGEGESVS